MKKDRQACCPGCSKHCPMNNVRCKYGKKYFEKQGPESAGDQKDKRRKWEKYVTGGGALWQLLHTAHCVKKAVGSGETDEEGLLSVLDTAEREQLGAILQKLQNRLENPL